MGKSEPLRWLLLVAVLALAPSVVAQPDDEPAALTEGKPVEIVLPVGRATWTGRLDLPADATALAVVVCGDRDADVYVRRGRPPAADDLAGTADVAAVGDAPHEIVLLGTQGDVRVRPGAWYVTVQNPFPRTGGLAFEVAAFVDRRRGRRTLLPGAPVGVRIPAPGRAFAVRTYLPRRVRSTTVDLDPPIPEGLRFRAEGPGGFVRRETTQQRILLDARDAPRGVYTLNLWGPAPSLGPRTLTARLTWVFPEGSILPLPPSPLLQPGRALPVLMGGPANGAVQPVRVQVPEESRGFVLSAASASGVNVDLYVHRSSVPHHKDEYAEWLGLAVGPREQVVVGGAEPLAPGTYHAEVLLVDDERPVEVLVTVTLLGEGDGPRTWGTAAPPLLEPDEWVPGAVRVYESALSWHAIDVPAGTKSLHAQLLDATGPLELVVARSEDGKIVGRAFTPLVDEHITHVFPAPLGAAQRFLVGVLNRATWDKEVAYRLAAALDRPPELPGDLVWPPGMRGDALSPAERTAAATVEITIGDCSGGSGICVSPRGLVLSCRHCLKLGEGAVSIDENGIIMAFPQELETPPFQAFYAEIVDQDPERDLVLLAPVRDVFERPLPETLHLPYLPLGDSTKLRLGESLWVAGYPQVGSECTRTAVILSRGVVAGLERRPTGPAWIKTDAWVAPGHSGGPLVDAEGRLVGIAAATLGRTESLGLAIPVGRIPPAWRERIAAEIAAKAPGDGE